MPKLLLFRGSPRSDIDEVERYNDKLPCDTIIIRHEREIPAYRQAREYFLSHPEYDYLVLATDDIVVLPEHIKLLQHDLEVKPYPVLSGMMNVDEVDWPEGRQNICNKLPNKLRTARNWKFIKNTSMPLKSIFMVAFAGFALTAIHRDVIRQIQFSGDGEYRGQDRKHGASLDLVFGYDCKDLNIPIFVDKRIKMQHLRLHGTFDWDIPPSTEVRIWTKES